MLYPQSGSLIFGDRIGTHTGLSTHIIIKVQDYAIGAIQELQISQDKGLKRLSEVGTGGVVEIIPTTPTAISITVRRVVFDGMSIPESFGRAFMNIQAQRIPFNIDIYKTDQARTSESSEKSGENFILDMDAKLERPVTVQRIHNCWFKQMTTPYTSRDYIITENATIWAEYMTTFTPSMNRSLRPAWPQRADIDTIEKEIDITGRRGSLSATSLEVENNRGKRSLRDLATTVKGWF